MQEYKKIAYLLGCYMVIADKEINAMELEVLERYLSSECDEELESQKKLIFSDADEKPDITKLLLDLKLLNNTKQQLNEIIQLLADVAFGDDYMANQEKDLILNIANYLNVDAIPIIKNSENCSKERIESNRLSFTKRTIGKAENFIYNLIPNKSKSEDTIDFLLGSLGYSTSIEKITDNAIVDLQRVTAIVEKFNYSLECACQTLNALKFSKKNCSEDVLKVAKTVSDIKEHFDYLIKTLLEDNLEILNKKHRNIRYFTIAFMGRTKAGKSTLHKVITQQEKGDIGHGQIRTTRYNRSWYWNKLRIVDTPGIGAPGGVEDTEIAKSIIDEADIICYIVTSDSIQETEFDFFETIKERNKPIYIILNVKSGIDNAIRRKRFLENPNGWMETSGPQSIKGHLDRIHERLDGKYNMDAVEIIPIHLLAALYGFSDDYSQEDSLKLREGSNILTFTRLLKAGVYNSGGIKKSLSVVDGTAYQLHHIALSLNEDLTQLKEGHDLLEKKLRRIKSIIKKESDKLFADIDSTFLSAKSELRNRASAFASENYDRSDAGDLWEHDEVVNAIYSRLNDRLTLRMEDFNEYIKINVEEFANDIKVIGTFNAESNVSGGGIKNTRLGVGVFGTILTAATPFIVANLWHPGGWIIAGVSLIVGTIFSFISSLFSSKADKIIEAIDNMRKSLFSSIDKGLKKDKSSFVTEVKKSIQEMNASISKLPSTYINGTDKIINEIESLIHQCEEDESAINSLVGFRILEYVGKLKVKDNDISLLDNHLLTEQYPVDRDWANQSITYKYNVDLTEKDIDRISRATQMKIFK